MGVTLAGLRRELLGSVYGDIKIDFGDEWWESNTDRDIRAVVATLHVSSRFPRRLAFLSGVWFWTWLFWRCSSSRPQQKDVAPLEFPARED